MTKLFKLAPAALAALTITGGAVYAQDMDLAITGTVQSWDEGAGLLRIEEDETLYHFRLDDPFPEGLDIGDAVEFNTEMNGDMVYIAEFFNITDQEEADLEVADDVSE
ncbi:hypothetical protein [Pseudoroseicyclus tamaricis]|uniref:DUF5666 domain-containing protein n=1 Tax=Pseudoroseicyclus tamaricis TaxID=2705421 RepID=A0A6B2JLC6_9RHOB|nr:hypothetical protein [Pseudoroseicyclus tamaricis]NDU99416.1 hypothetical protein [Pseudoroseicyclus tamaricis]